MLIKILSSNLNPQHLNIFRMFLSNIMPSFTDVNEREEAVFNSFIFYVSTSSFIGFREIKLFL